MADGTAGQGDLAVVALLANGGWHSGARLAAGLGLSRAAVHKAIHRAAERLGLAVETRRGQGYRLAVPLELLDAGVIRSALPPAASAALGGLVVLPEVGSTNTWLLEQGRAGAPSGLVCLAERQSAGRGRQGRVWVAPVGGSLALSILWRFRLAPGQLGGVSLAAGVAVLEALALACPGLALVERDSPAAGADGVGLKWPNDLQWRGRKLAGLLLEVSGEAQGPSQVVLGLGLNLRLPAAAGTAIDQPWVDLAGVLAAGGLPLPSRNALAAALIGRLLALGADYERSGFAAWQPRWQRHDAWRGREAQVQDGARTLRGVLAGIDADGALLLDTADGRRQLLTGEVSVRPVVGG